MDKIILIRGGGDLSTGVALRLQHAGFKLFIVELPEPMAVRRSVSFSEAIYRGEMLVEGLCAQRVDTAKEAFERIEAGIVPVMIDPELSVLDQHHFPILLDARLLKRTSDTSIHAAPLVIGLGPGFTCGENCHAVIETQRGHFLGRVYWTGSASPDTGQPEGDARRVLRAPRDGIFNAAVAIGDRVETGQVIGDVNGENVLAPFEGVLRGLIRPGVFVQYGVKIGDIDQRNDPSYCYSVSDKALSIGGGVLEAILSWSSRQLV